MFHGGYNHWLYLSLLWIKKFWINWNMHRVDLPLRVQMFAKEILTLINHHELRHNLLWAKSVYSCTSCATLICRHGYSTWVSQIDLWITTMTCQLMTRWWFVTFGQKTCGFSANELFVICDSWLLATWLLNSYRNDSCDSRLSWLAMAPAHMFYTCHCLVTSFLTSIYSTASL